MRRKLYILRGGKVSRHAVILACVLVGVGASYAGPANATTYRFAVSCSNRRLVAEWDTGTVDPGKEYLRVTTGTKFANCSVTDYDATRDASLPVEKYSGATGVIEGIPLLGPILCGIFNC